MNTPFTHLLMINVHAVALQDFALVPVAEASERRTRGWASMLLKDFVYQKENDQLRISVPKVREPGKASSYIKPSEAVLVELAKSQTLIEFENGCYNHFTNKKHSGFIQVWINRECVETRARMLANFRQDNDYELPDNYEWLEVDLGVFDLRNQLEDYLDKGLYPLTVDLDKAFLADRDLIAQFILRLPDV